MSDLVYYLICAVLTAGVLVGIFLMSKVKTAKTGNALSAVCTAAAIFITLYRYEILSAASLWICLAIGLALGMLVTYRVKMIEMPQMVALLNGFGGAASALVALISMLDGYSMDIFGLITAGLALLIGMVTLTGSLVAAGKLHKLLPQKPIRLPCHSLISTLSLLVGAASVIVMPIAGFQSGLLPVLVLICAISAGMFGVAFSIRVGGADMPITISLLNSFSGVAGSIAGMAISDPLLVAIGGIVGASGLLLTQIMCRSMNRSLGDILLGKTSVEAAPATTTGKSLPESKETEIPENDLKHILNSARRVIIIPGYGMALAQAQSQVKQLADRLAANGANVSYAIHPVAGRMPGHMNVLLCEADVPYEDLHEMEEINPEFPHCDLAVVVGANDVVNPAANTAEGTPIYGMPILDAEKARHVIVCNYDLNPGYAGVPNPLYERDYVTVLQGDAKESVESLITMLDTAGAAASGISEAEKLDELLKNSKNIIIIPGYGMALAQAQTQVKQLADRLAANGADVSYAIHPVAGRMPGHMNVLLCEADVSYEDLREMEEINPEFPHCDLAIVVGANDVVNPAANTAEGTPIYGMPILDAEKARHVIVCNYDLNPGYAGVPNPLYERDYVTVLQGDAKESLQLLTQAV